MAVHLKMKCTQIHTTATGIYWNFILDNNFKCFAAILIIIADDRQE